MWFLILAIMVETGNSNFKNDFEIRMELMYISPALDLYISPTMMAVEFTKWFSKVGIGFKNYLCIPTLRFKFRTSTSSPYSFSLAAPSLFGLGSIGLAMNLPLSNRRLNWYAESEIWYPFPIRRDVSLIPLFTIGCKYNFTGFQDLKDYLLVPTKKDRSSYPYLLGFIESWRTTPVMGGIGFGVSISRFEIQTTFATLLIIFQQWGVYAFYKIIAWLSFGIGVEQFVAIPPDPTVLPGITFLLFKPTIKLEVPLRRNFPIYIYGEISPWTPAIGKNKESKTKVVEYYWTTRIGLKFRIARR